MSILGRIFGGRRRREARRELEARVRAALEREGPDAAWGMLAAALPSDPEASELFHLASLVLRAGAEIETAELFDRAADAPHDPQRMFELGSHLLSSDQAELAAAILEQALAFVPFDAVVRSELAIAQARSGRPESAVETLALHPCLADDPGALFQFAWASLLAGDLEAAEGALGELHGAGALREKLRAALERAKLGIASDPPDARDFYFIEHGGLVIDAAGPLGGRYDALELDAARAGQLISVAGALIRELAPSEAHRVIVLDDDHEPLARALATACGGRVISRGKGRMPAAVLPLLTGARMSDLDREHRDAEGPLVFALTAAFDRGTPRAPDVVGAFVRSPDVSRAFDAAPPTIDPMLRAFVDARKESLFPRAKYPYVPDEPLPRR